MKKCYGCAKEKPKTDFSKNKSKPDGLQTRCKSCSSVANKRTYETLPHRRVAIAERNIATRKKHTKLVNRVKRFSGCKVCGEREPVVLDFHHLDPKSKDREVPHLIGYSIERLRQEIRKCVVLCANCHRKVHAGLLLV